jgi:hypothetical protein
MRTTQLILAAIAAAFILIACQTRYTVQTIDGIGAMRLDRWTGAAVYVTAVERDGNGR